MWEGQLVLADGGWRVIAPHFRGVDAGTGDPPTVSIDDYAADVIDLLDALHIDQAVIGGLSMGGYTAFAILRHAARYVQGLILADTRAEADAPEGLEGRRKMLRSRAVERRGGGGGGNDPEAARRDDAALASRTSSTTSDRSSSRTRPMRLPVRCAR